MVCWKYIETEMKQLILISLFCLLAISSLRAIELIETLALAERGDVVAQFSLGATYDLGEEGVPQEDVKAALWYLKAAENGHNVSQLKIGRMYLDGRGIQQDRIEAWAWLFMARGGSSRPKSKSAPQDSATNPDDLEVGVLREIGGNMLPPTEVNSQAWTYFDIATNKLSDNELVDACLRGLEIFVIVSRIQSTMSRQQCIDAVPVIRKDVAEAAGG